MIGQYLGIQLITNHIEHILHYVLIIKAIFDSLRHKVTMEKLEKTLEAVAKKVMKYFLILLFNYFLILIFAALVPRVVPRLLDSLSASLRMFLIRSSLVSILRSTIKYRMTQIECQSDWL